MFSKILFIYGIIVQSERDRRDGRNVTFCIPRRCRVLNVVIFQRIC